MSLVLLKHGNIQTYQDNIVLSGYAFISNPKKQKSWRGGFLHKKSIEIYHFRKFSNYARERFIPLQFNHIQSNFGIMCRSPHSAICRTVGLIIKLILKS